MCLSVQSFYKISISPSSPSDKSEICETDHIVLDGPEDIQRRIKCLNDIWGNKAELQKKLSSCLLGTTLILL